MFVVIALCVATIGQSQEVDKNIFKKPWIVILPGFESFMRSVPQTFVASKVEVIGKMVASGTDPQVSPTDMKPFVGVPYFASILAGNFTGQMYVDTCTEATGLCQRKVNYFYVSDSTAGNFVVKIYKRIDIADGKWYIDAMPAENMFAIVDGYILEPK